MATKRAQLYLSGVPAADELLSSDPLALLIGLVLDQQIPLEWAFEGPLNLTKRLGGNLDIRRIAQMSPDDLVAAFLERPSLHRYPASMAARVQALCRLIIDEYAGDPARIWTTADTGEELLRRVVALPGFGMRKAKIFVALLGKQLGVGPPGWEEASAPFGEAGSHLSVADIDSPDTLVLVREHKRALKAAAKAARPAAPAPARPTAKKAATKKAAAKGAGATDAVSARKSTNGRRSAPAKKSPAQPPANRTAKRASGSPAAGRSAT